MIRFEVFGLEKLLEEAEGEERREGRREEREVRRKLVKHFKIEVFLIG